MKVSVILNPQSGTLRNVNIELLRITLRQALGNAGLDLVSWHTEARSVNESLQSAMRHNPDCLLVAGGDGSVSAAAKMAWSNEIALAILPGGTMNLYSRTLGLPQDIIECAAAYSASHLTEVDVATIDDQVFLHQFTVGLHAQAVRLRNTMAYGSRLSKIIASIRAFGRVVFHPPRFKVGLVVDGQSFGTRRVSALSVTNNVFGEGHIPYADIPDGGVLGVYYSDPIRFMAAIRLIVDTMMGATNDNPYLHDTVGRKVILQLPRKRNWGMLDGEIINLGNTMTLQTHPRSLRVLLPDQASGE
ncbi:diacylglycerol/lipid kinase family protein [Granulosicoccus sp. 3-233]|uniref:diacylglycerol/lipid kinase family protein n=1 Tax=Granulosicoccus sp. 3-233 TaxID=3417969 RepID=UPI003D34E79F